MPHRLHEHVASSQVTAPVIDLRRCSAWILFDVKCGFPLSDDHGMPTVNLLA